MSEAEIELLLELVRLTKDEQEQIMKSVREIRESQQECAEILNQYRGAFRVAGWIVGFIVSVGGVVAALRFKG